MRRAVLVVLLLVGVGGTAAADGTHALLTAGPIGGVFADDPAHDGTVWFGGGRVEALGHVSESAWVGGDVGMQWLRWGVPSRSGRIAEAALVVRLDVASGRSRRRGWRWGGFVGLRLGLAYAWVGGLDYGLGVAGGFTGGAEVGIGERTRLRAQFEVTARGKDDDWWFMQLEPTVGLQIVVAL